MQLPPLPSGTAIAIPDGKITISWMNMPGGGVTFQMEGEKRGEVQKMPAIQVKAIVMQALAVFADMEFQNAVRASQQMHQGAPPELLKQA